MRFTKSSFIGVPREKGFLVKIMVVSHGFPPELVGGTERYVAALSKSLVTRGHAVSVFAGSIAYTGRIEVRDDVIDSIPTKRVVRGDLFFDSWDKTFNPHVSELWKRELERVRPDVVHIHHWIRLSSDLVRVAKGMKVPVVATLHDFYLTCPRTFRIRDETISCDRGVSPESCAHCVPRWKFQSDSEVEASISIYADEIREEALGLSRAIAPSECHAQALARFQSALDGKIVVEAHPWLDEIVPAIRSQGPPLKVLVWSHLQPLKGQDVLLRAIHKLEDPLSVRVELWGGAFVPSYKHKLEDLAKGLDVHFMGEFHPTDLGGREIDIAVIPTKALESYSFIFDEAVRLGVPIIASEIGALGERRSGRVLFVPPDDPNALACALQDLVDHPTKRADMEKADAPTIVDIDRHSVRIESIYREVIAEEADHAMHVEKSSPSMDLSTRLVREWDRREEGFKNLVRSEGWDDVIAEKNQEIEKLRGQIEELRRGREGNP